MIFNSKKLSQTIETIQEFILEDSFPIPINTTCMISAKGGVGKTNLSLFIASEYTNKHNGTVCLWLTEDEYGNSRHRVNKLLEHDIIKPFQVPTVELITFDLVYAFVTNCVEAGADDV
jgi:predicted NACHT family NTPase